MTTNLSFEDWEVQFKESDLYKTLQGQYNYLYPDLCDAGLGLSVTKPGPKDSFRNTLHETSRFFYAYLYYLEYINELQPSLIGEVGFGFRFIYNTIPYPVKMITGHHLDRFANQFDCGISMTSLHFYPLTELANNINHFTKIIKTNGRGFFSVNLERMLERTNMNAVFGKEKPTIIEIEDFVKEELKKVTSTILVEDILISKRHKKFYDALSDERWPEYDKFINNDIDTTQLDKDIKHTLRQFRIYNFANDSLNGNIRLVLEK